MQSVIATFDDPATARAAVDSLIAYGFSAQSVHLQASAVTSTRLDANGRTVSAGDKGFLSGVGRFFSHLFESDDTTDADKYAEAVKRGSRVVVVDVKDDEEVANATDVMDDMGAVDVEERAEAWKAQGWKGFDADAAYTDQDAAFANQSVPVLQEELKVGKRTVNVGGLRVIKRMSEKPVSEIVSLREEHATIERRPVDRAATEADFTNFKEGTLEVRETAEEAVVGKIARVVEEVTIDKAATERLETVSDTVRRTDVEVDRLPGEKISTTTESRKR
jgi:uncharacterized protein (TIGR02271 family)